MCLCHIYCIFFNQLAARAAERELKEARHEAGVLRQKYVLEDVLSVQLNMFRLKYVRRCSVCTVEYV